MDVEVREHGCGCVVWTSGNKQSSAAQLPSGIASVELLSSKSIAGLPTEHTLVVGLTAGSYAFRVGPASATTPVFTV